MIYGVTVSLFIVLILVAPAWTAEDAINATYYDNSPSSNLTYTGAWTHGTGWSRAYFNTVSYSNNTGDKVKLTFTGGSTITRVYTMTNN